MTPASRVRLGRFNDQRFRHRSTSATTAAVSSARPCRDDAARAAPWRVAASRCGPNRRATSLPGAARRQPASPMPTTSVPPVAPDRTDFNAAISMLLCPSRLSHFWRKFCETVHSCPRLVRHGLCTTSQSRNRRPGFAYCLDLTLIKPSSLAVAIIAATPTKLTTNCIISPSEMLNSARWPANASRTPRQ